MKNFGYVRLGTSISRHERDRTFLNDQKFENLSDIQLIGFGFGTEGGYDLLFGVRHPYN